jgi:hypothetical protein
MSALAPEDLAGANGKLVLFLASILQRADILPMTEFAQLLSVFANSVAETDPGEAAVLARWAAAIGTPSEH